VWRIRKGKMTDPIQEVQRKEVFRVLVELQDEGSPTEQSRSQVAEQFSMSLRDVQMIEREGIAKQWPPL
jgi:hypothetical protein